MSETQTNAQVVRHFFETLSTGDLERVRALFHPDATWAVMCDGIPGAGMHSGRDVIVDEFLAPVRGMFEPGDPKVQIDSLVADGNLVAVEARGRGRFLDGRPYENRYAFVV
jgi:ketosteroid isomerase-like protein